MRLLIIIYVCYMLLSVTVCTNATEQDINTTAFTIDSTSKTVPEHFHPKGKMPSTYTVELQKKLRETLPFQDKQG